MSVASKVVLEYFGTPAAAARALGSLLSLLSLLAVARRAARARAQQPHAAPRPPRRLPPPRRRPGVRVDRVLLRRLARLLRLCVPRLASAEAALMILLAALLALRTALTLVIARTIGRSSGALVARRARAFLFGVADLAMYYVPTTVTAVGIEYTVAVLERRFRARMQTALHAEYFSGFNLYNIATSGAVDNPAHRMTTDVQRFCRELADLLPALLRPLLNIGIFTATLARLGGCAAPAAMLSYYALTAALFRAALPNFTGLVAYSRGKEGNLRTMHTQLIQHAEEVAFYRGEEVERQNANRLLQSFARIERYIKRTKWWTTLLNAVCMKHGATCVGYIACAIGACHAQGTLDAVGLTQLQMQSTQLYIPLSLAVGRLLSLHLKLGALCSSAHRIGELRDALRVLAQRTSDVCDTRYDACDARTVDNPQRGTVIELACEDRVALHNVAIVSPATHVLVGEMTLEFAAGRDVLVTGTNGSGKTALLLTVAGLWPLRCGVIERPPLHRLIFLTQRVYLPPGTLRAQLVYPAVDSKSSIESNNAVERDTHSDGELLAFAAALGLTGVIEREGGLDAVNEWGEILSGGERQRIALLRVLVHRPAFAFLDECTSAVSQDVEPALFASLRRAGVTLVTVSHREGLGSGYAEVLHMDGMGGYTLRAGSPTTTGLRTETSFELVP